MDSTVMSPGAGPTLMANDDDRRGDHSNLWNHAILRETSENHKFAGLHEIEQRARLQDQERLLHTRIEELRVRQETNHGELKMLFSEKINAVTDLLKEQELTRLRDKIAAVPRGVSVTVPCTL